jgi:hypothetical protein
MASPNPINTPLTRSQRTFSGLSSRTTASTQYDSTEVVFDTADNCIKYETRDRLFNNGQLGMFPLLSYLATLVSRPVMDS